MNEREECYKRIAELEKAIESALKISDLWRPQKDIEVDERNRTECQVLELMYQLLKKH